MSAIKERAKALIDQLPEEVVRTLLEDLEDALELQQAISEENDQPGIPLETFIDQLKHENKLSE